MAGPPVVALSGGAVRRVLLAFGLVALTTLLLSLKSAPGATRLPDPLPANQRAAPTGASGPPPTGGPESAPSAAPPALPSTDGTTYTGDSAYTDFGYVTVQVTVSGRHLIDVAAVELPTDEARSAALSARVAPILRERALAAQSSSFDTVSGATWTSEAYQLSLRSALIKAGLV
jgi:uncharacterized protein with FMN-binding domain